MIKRILVGVAGTPATAAKVHYAVDLAKRFDASLSLLSIVDSSRLTRVGPAPVGALHLAAQMGDTRVRISREQSEEALATFEARCRTEGVPFDVIRREGDPFDLLVQAWRYHDLCVLGLRGWFDYRVVAEPQTTVQRLVGQGVRPILAVAETLRPIGKAMIAYDGSLEAAKAMKRFVQLALWPDVRLHITCINRRSEEAELLLEEACRYCRAWGHAPETSAIQGEPWAEIVRYADAIGADIIVLGSGLHAGFMQRTFGTTAMQVIREADRPLFLSH